MKRMKSILPQTVVLCLLYSSCSVKENRSDCPCLLDVTLSGTVESSANLSVWNPELQYMDDIEGVREGTRYQCEIKRGNVILSVCSGGGCAPDAQGNVIVSEGEPMAELYAVSSEVDATGEMASSEVRLNRQFAFLHLNLLCIDPSVEEPEIELTGDCDGMNLRTMTPHAGAFSVKVRPVFGEYCRVSLPRQYDDSLKLLLEGHGPISLGNYIRAAGYDWNAVSLEDIYVDIDVAECTLLIKIAPWGQEAAFTYCF